LQKELRDEKAAELQRFVPFYWAFAFAEFPLGEGSVMLSKNGEKRQKRRRGWRR
jgi:hypothetical protein